MHSLAHHFMALISQICVKGFISETEEEMMYILGEKKLKWSREQIENLLVIQLHPESSQEYKIEDAIKIIEDAGESLKITKKEMDTIKESVTEGLRISNKSPLAIKEVITSNLIDKIKGYKTLQDSLKDLNWFIDQRWQSLIKDFTPMVKKMFEDCIPGNIQTSTFQDLVDHYFALDKFTLNYYGIGIAKLNQTIADVGAIVDFSDKLAHSDSEIERAIILFEMKSTSDINWLKSYYAKNQELPFFWLLRNFILVSCTDRKGQIYLNAISHSPLKIKELAEAYDKDEERIRQILQNFESDLDLVLVNYFAILKRTGKLEKFKVDCRNYLDSITTSIFKINIEENLDLTEDFFKILLGKLLEEECLLIGTKKLLIKNLYVGPIPTKGHRWQNLHLITKMIKKESLEEIVNYFDKICSEHFNEMDIIIPENILNLFDKNILDLINKEGESWQVRRKVNKPLQNSFTDTFFNLSGDFKLTWLERVENLSEKELRVLREIFYELELNCPIEGSEIVNKYFISQMLDESFMLDPTKISRHSECLEIVNIANKWMAKDYALAKFHPNILKVKKANFKDAIYYHLLKENELQGKTKTEWAQILNEILKHDYKSNNLQAISDDPRFELKGRLIYLKSYE